MKKDTCNVIAIIKKMAQLNIIESALLSSKFCQHIISRAPLKIPKKSKSIQPGGQFHLILKVFLSNN
ncbi:hypothetical protein AAW31_14200 [Nitrosomonas communis]|uniref:Uncharacterized protein n=1 Tax=Nitrosomonas communis TaxID=44574 RepID=A0A0F7KII5_9PROT|nr:hypothetical protein AAW31_14200 [Nitrosomonas communis]